MSQALAVCLSGPCACHRRWPWQPPQFAAAFAAHNAASRWWEEHSWGRGASLRVGQPGQGFVTSRQSVDLCRPQGGPVAAVTTRCINSLSDSGAAQRQPVVATIRAQPLPWPTASQFWVPANRTATADPLLAATRGVRDQIQVQWPGPGRGPGPAAATPSLVTRRRLWPPQSSATTRSSLPGSHFVKNSVRSRRQTTGRAFLL